MSYIYWKNLFCGGPCLLAATQSICNLWVTKKVRLFGISAHLPKAKDKIASWPLWCSPDTATKQNGHISTLGGRTNFGWKSGFCHSEPCLTFTVGIIVSKWAEAVLTNTAVSRLEVHTVRVLHAAVALWAEVMTCRRHVEEKVETQRREEERSDGGIQGVLERLCHSAVTFSLSILPCGSFPRYITAKEHSFPLIYHSDVWSSIEQKHVYIGDMLSYKYK